MKTLKFLIVGLLFTVSASANSIAPELHKWEKLGTKKVSFKLDKDVIHVGVRKGGFKKVKIQVTGGTVKMHKMVVKYQNGEKQIIPLKHIFKPRSGSRVIDLNGNKRIVKNITFLYDSANIPGQRATIHLFGKH